MNPSVFIFKGSSEKAYAFVSAAACKQLNLTEKPEIVKTGKPYLKDFPNFHFNISHSGDLAAVAFAESPVGVDIEVHRRVNLKIAHRYFTEKEKNYVKDNISFFYVWTRKEALLKQSGEGLRGIFRSEALENNNIITIQNNDYTLSVCTASPKDFEFIYEENF